MGLYSNFPYTDFENLNLDWIISEVKEYIIKVDKLDIDFIDLKKYVEENIEDIKEYVNDYFDNLDVQEEVDNKLQEMYDSGELLQLIEQFLNVNTILTFNTTASLKNGTQFVNDSTAMRLGDLTYNDGKTDLYKIRTLTSSDVIDEVNILSLTNFPTLIAELLPSFNRTSEDIYILIGDSYGNNTTRDGVYVTGWVTRFMNVLGLTDNSNCFHMIEGQAGYSNKGVENHDFQDLLQIVLDGLDTDQLKRVKYVVMAGGTNDVRYNYSGEYETGAQALNTILTTYIPQAKCFIIPIGFTNESRGLRRQVNPVYKKIREAYTDYPNINYISNAYTPLRNEDYMVSDRVHLNNEGTIRVLENIINGLNGTNSWYTDTQDLTFSWDDVTYSTADTTIETRLNENLMVIQFAWSNFGLDMVNPISWTTNTSEKKLGTFTSKLLPDNINLRIAVSGRLRDTGGVYHNFTGYLHLTNGEIGIITLSTGASGNGWETFQCNRIYLDKTIETTIVDYI